MCQLPQRVGTAHNGLIPGPFRQLVKVGFKARDPVHLHLIIDTPFSGVGTGAADKRIDLRCCASVSDGTSRIRAGFFAGHDPLMQQRLMIDKKRRHTEASGITDPKMSGQPRIKISSLITATLPGQRHEQQQKCRIR